MGGLNLTTRDGLLKGGASGPAIALNKPDSSLLLAAVRYQGRQMPPSGKLAPAQIEILAKWIQQGAPWSNSPNTTKEPVHIVPPPVNDQTRRFWSFQPVRRPAVPKVAGTHNPIDAFILRRLQSAKLTPNPLASKTALLRRVTYDLIGLPPTLAETRAFLADKSSNAYERVVDRLLASPRYGEKWGRHWLDLVRFAETNSYERDGVKPNAWRYRDYVVNAFNADKPYNQFVMEQLAGDELDTRTPERLIATGYYRLGIWDDEPSDPEQALYDDLDDVVSTTGQVFLGLSVGCARCHDSKIDPIPQKDYYRLTAFFNGLERYGSGSQRPIVPLAEQQRYKEAITAYQARVKTNADALTSIEKPLLAGLTPVEKEEFRDDAKRPAIVEKRVPKLLSTDDYARYMKLRSERDEIQKNAPPALDSALCATEVGTTPRLTHVLMRGNPHAEGDVVTPGFPSVITTTEPNLTPSRYDDSSGRRLALANWIADARNPLTARVMVNRIWQYHFGRGLVRTPSNFGFQGSKPTHPELLDWLASEFVAKGWKLKPLHKLILMSSAYQRSSQGQKIALARDPENDLFWQFDMRRLEAEEVRDSILAVNGSLNLQMGGPGVYPVMPDEVLAGQSMPGSGWGKSPLDQQCRRSIYIHTKRSLITPMLASFDGPETDFTCPVRFATTQPTQALGMLNSAFVNEQARVFASSIRRDVGTKPDAQVRRALWRVIQREPTSSEINRGVKLMASLQARHHLSADAALTYFCVVALNLDEFLYLD